MKGRPGPAKKRDARDSGASRGRKAECEARQSRRLQTENTLRLRLTYEKMVADVSAQAVLAEEVDRFQDACLKILGEAMDVSRIYIFKVDQDRRTMSNTFEWVAPGIAPQKAALQDISWDAAPWWMEMICAGRVINCRDIEELPGDQEKKILRPQGIKSLLVVPFFLEGALYGFMGFDECRQHRQWLEEDVRLLKTISEIMTGVLLRKRWEKELRESELRHRRTLDAAPDAITITRVEDGRIMDVSGAFCRMMGYSREEALGSTPFELNLFVDPTVRGRFIKILEERGEVNGFELQYRKKDGTVIDALFSARPIRINGDDCLVSVVTDITEKKRLEEKLHRAQRMEAIGTLAGGLAHDFNNLLMAIQGNISLLMMDTPPGDPRYELLENLEISVRSGADLTRQLLGFARGGKYETKPMDLNALLAKTSRLFGRTRRDIRIQTNFDPALHPVEADEGQMEQVLLNLYVNAWQAMPRGGTICLESQNLAIASGEKASVHLPPGDYVRIAVRDTGTGMDEKTRQRIFEPFFSTKELGRGTGLGLASAYGIVRNHGGMIDVESQAGGGTTFFIYLPRSHRNAPPRRTVRDVLPQGRGTVLFVDDEESVLGVCAKMLERIGYRTMAARSGPEALSLYASNRARIDAVILDMIMPEMDGAEVFERLKAMDPGVKVLLSSGYSKEGLASDILGRGCAGFIQKPFTMKELVGKLRGILEG
jgi:PAS domain S-box-containing protein